MPYLNLQYKLQGSLVLHTCLDRVLRKLIDTRVPSLGTIWSHLIGISGSRSIG